MFFLLVGHDVEASCALPPSFPPRFNKETCCVPYCSIYIHVSSFRGYVVVCGRPRYHYHEWTAGATPDLPAYVFARDCFFACTVKSGGTRSVSGGGAYLPLTGFRRPLRAHERDIAIQEAGIKPFSADTPAFASWPTYETTQWGDLSLAT